MAIQHYHPTTVVGEDVGDSVGDALFVGDTLFVGDALFVGDTL